MNQFSAFETWSTVLIIASLAAILLVSNVLRRKIRFLKRSLLPTAVIGGFVALGMKEWVLVHFLSQTQIADLNTFFSGLTYHTIALGFIALGLKVHEKFDIVTRKSHGLYSGMIIVSSYLIQGLVGLVVTITLSLTFFPQLLRASGMLLPMGFGQGPGQASNIGALYETQYLFVGGQTFGLAIASFGFLWAAVGGVIYLNILHRKGKISRTYDQTSGSVSSQEIESPDEIPVAEAIDKFSIQVSLVLLVYLFTYLFMKGIDVLIEADYFGNFGVNTVRPLIWGFNFIFGMLFALLFKRIFLYLRKVNIMTRQYPNNYMLNRIAGVVFDFMIIASIAAIKINDLKDLWVPFLILTSLGGLATVFYIRFICARIYEDYPIEATLGMFGMLTGTASSGVILIREVDPNFKTPAANDLVVGSSTAILFGFPILLLVGIAPAGNLQLIITFGLVVVLLVVFNTILLRRRTRKPLIKPSN